MVFGWGKKKEVEVEQVEPSKKEISISDVPKVVDDLTELRTKQLVSEVKILRDKTNPKIKELADIIKKLEKDDLKVDDVEKHLRIIVVRGKKQVIAAVKKDTSDLPKVSSYDDVIKLHTTINQTLKRIGDALGRQTRVIHIFAKKYAGIMKTILEEIKSNNDEIHNLITNHNNTLDSSNIILESIEKINQIKNSVSKQSDRKEEFLEHLTLLEQNTSSVNTSIEEIKNSQEYKQYLSLQESLKQKTNEKISIKNEVDSQFTKISRPLSRYEYGSSLDKEQKELLHQLITNPIDALLPQNKDDIIVILENIRKAIASGSISVKDVEKTMTHLTEIEESVGSLTKKVNQFLESKKDLETQLNSIKPKKLSELESELSKSTIDKEDLESRIKQIDQEAENEQSNIPKLKNEIETNLRLFSNTIYTLTE